MVGVGRVDFNAQRTAQHGSICHIWQAERGARGTMSKLPGLSLSM